MPYHLSSTHQLNRWPVGLWAVVFLGVSIWATFEFANTRIPPMQALYALRSIASFSATVSQSCQFVAVYLAKGRSVRVSSELYAFVYDLESHEKQNRYGPSFVQVGFIPMFELLLSTASCNTRALHNAPDWYWTALGFTCFSGGHLAIVLIALVLALGFALVVGIFTFVFVDSNPLSPGLLGASSGRSSLVMLLWKVGVGVPQ